MATKKESNITGEGHDEHGRLVVVHKPQDLREFLSQQFVQFIAFLGFGAGIGTITYALLKVAPPKLQDSLRYFATFNLEAASSALQSLLETMPHAALEELILKLTELQSNPDAVSATVVGALATIALIIISKWKSETRMMVVYRETDSVE